MLDVIISIAVNMLTAMNATRLGQVTRSCWQCVYNFADLLQPNLPLPYLK